MAGHVVIAIHRVHSLETNRAEPICRQSLVLSELIYSHGKEKELEIYLYCTVRSWTMSTMCPFLMVPCRVGLQSMIEAFLGNTLSFLKL